MTNATNKVEAYITRLGWDLNLPVFAVKHDGDFLTDSAAVAFDVFVGDEHVCAMTLENKKWTARDARTGRKISARKGAWWNSATVAVKKFAERIGYADCAKIRADYHEAGRPRTAMVVLPG